MGCGGSVEAATASQGPDKAEIEKLQTELRNAHPMFITVDFNSVSKALRENFLSNEWSDLEAGDVPKCVKLLQKWRKDCTLFKFEATSKDLQYTNGYVDRVGKVNEISNLAEKRPNLARDFATALGISPDDLDEAVHRIVLCVECLLAAALLGTPLMAVGKQREELHGKKWSKVATEALPLFFSSYESEWNAAAKKYGKEAAKSRITEGESDVVDQLARISHREYLHLLRSCAQIGVMTISFFLGGRRNVAPLQRHRYTQVFVPQSDTLSTLICGFTKYCANPAQGMESDMEVNDQTGYLMALLAVMGFLPMHTVGDDFHEWVRWLPFPLLTPAAKATLVYIDCIGIGQRKLPLKNLERSHVLGCALESLWKASKGKDPVTFKVWPAFLNESGEGHGPRKEFFDLCAKELLSGFKTVEVDHFATISGNQGNPIVVASPRAGHPLRSASSSSPYQLMDELLVPGNQIFFPVSVSKDDLVEFVAIIQQVEKLETGKQLTLSAALPAPAKDVLLGGVRKPQPQFFELMRPGSTFCWFSQVVPDVCDGVNGLDAQIEHAVSSPNWVYNRSFLVGWLCGTVLANGVNFSLPLPRIFFKFLRHYLAGKERELKTTESDLINLDEDYRTTIEQIRGMDAEKFEEYSSATVMDEDEDDDEGEEGTDPTKDPPLPDPGLPLIERKNKFIEQHIADGLLVRRVWYRMKAVADGFFASAVSQSHILSSMSEDDLQTMIVGEVDNELKDFDFDQHFLLTWDPEFSLYQHSFVFKRLLNEVLRGTHLPDPEGCVKFKRDLLRFITGRVLLPPQPFSETIFIHSGLCCTTVGDYIDAGKRLPGSHTCSNTLEVPNYLECLLFNPTVCGYQPSDPIRETMKGSCWSDLDAATKANFRQTATEMLVQKLTLAVRNAGSYELDDMEDGGGFRAPPTKQIHQQHSTAGEVAAPSPKKEDSEDNDNDSEYEMPAEDYAGGIIGEIETGTGPFISGQLDGPPEMIVNADDDEYEMPGEA